MSRQGAHHRWMAALRRVDSWVEGFRDAEARMDLAPDSSATETSATAQMPSALANASSHADPPTPLPPLRPTVGVFKSMSDMARLTPFDGLRHAQLVGQRASVSREPPPPSPAEEGEREREMLRERQSAHDIKPPRLPSSEIAMGNSDGANREHGYQNGALDPSHLSTGGFGIADAFMSREQPLAASVWRAFSSPGHTRGFHSKWLGRDRKKDDGYWSCLYGNSRDSSILSSAGSVDSSGDGADERSFEFDRTLSLSTDTVDLDEHNGNPSSSQYQQHHGEGSLPILSGAETQSGTESGTTSAAASLSLVFSPRSSLAASAPATPQFWSSSRADSSGEGPKRVGEERRSDRGGASADFTVAVVAFRPSGLC